MDAAISPCGKLATIPVGRFLFDCLIHDWHPRQRLQDGDRAGFHAWYRPGRQLCRFAGARSSARLALLPCVLPIMTFASIYPRLSWRNDLAIALRRLTDRWDFSARNKIICSVRR